MIWGGGVRGKRGGIKNQTGGSVFFIYVFLYLNKCKNPRFEAWLGDRNLPYKVVEVGSCVRLTRFVCVDLE